MFGWRDEFEYFQCSRCDCLQISEFPPDISKYYASGYYSLEEAGRLKRFLRQRWARHALGRLDPAGWALALVEGPHLAAAALKRSGVPIGGRLLDVGCGSGQFLSDLEPSPLTQLHGIDPFLSADQPGTRVSLWKREICNHTGGYEFITFNHSFEHLANPLQTLQAARTLLASSGVIIVRIPFVDSFAWREYRTDWASLDAPRHYFLHSRKSLELLAGQADLELAALEFESNMDQFHAGEQYRRGIPLLGKKSFIRRRFRNLSQAGEDRAYRKRAIEVNRLEEGDLVCVRFRIGSSKA